MLRHILAFAALVSLFCAPAQAATRIDDPVKFVKSLYAQVASATEAKPYDPPTDIYTPRLAALFALDKKEAGGEVGRIDFDIWTNAQDFQLSGVSVIGKPVFGGKDREVVIAKFRNFKDAQELHFYFQKTPTGWQLDDARALTVTPWTLSLILKYGWDDEK